MKKSALVILWLLLGPCFAQTNLPTTLDSIRIAEAFPGSDCGAKITAAFGDFPLGTTGQVWVSNACGLDWTYMYPVSIPAKGALVFTQGGHYTTTQGIIMNSNSALYSQVPAAPTGGPVILRALNGLANLITVNGAQAVIHDVTLDGYATFPGNTTPDCQAGGGTTSSSNLINISSGAGHMQMERVEVECSGGVGIYNNGAPNIDLSHMEVLGNAKQGFLCVNAGDGFVQSDSQFDGNGLPGIELNGCGSYRMVNIDVSGNGSLGTDKSTGCSLYIHGTASTNVAYNNTFVQMQQGNDAFEDICDIGWDSVNNGRDSYLNSFVGLQELGRSTSYPSIYVSDGSTDLFQGTIGIGAPTSYGIQFSEGSTGRAIPSTARLAFAAGTTPTTAWNDTTRYGDDFTGSIIGSNENYYVGPFSICTTNTPNSQCTETITSAQSPTAPLYNNLDTANIVGPQLQSGGYELGFQVGQAQDTNYQSALYDFVYQGNGSTSNKACLGVFGAANSLCVNGASVPSVGLNNVPVQSTATQTAGKLACIKAVGPPPVIGTCTAVSGATCTSCN